MNALSNKCFVRFPLIFCTISTATPHFNVQGPNFLTSEVLQLKIQPNIKPQQIRSERCIDVCRTSWSFRSMIDSATLFLR